LLALVCLTVAPACKSKSQPSAPHSSVGTPSQWSSASPSASLSAAAVPTEAPVAPEKNPPGDIPDTQVFIDYHSVAGGYTLKVPEGWARTEMGSSVRFADKLNSIQVDVVAAQAAPTVDSVKTVDEPELKQSVRAFEEVKVEPATLPGGPAVLLRYRANSDPDPVTGKAARLEVDRYEIYGNGKMAALSLSAPVGADNVDDWKLVSKSFKWS
jgi:hypothetical protein